MLEVVAVAARPAAALDLCAVLDGGLKLSCRDVSLNLSLLQMVTFDDWDQASVDRRAESATFGSNNVTASFVKMVVW